ncbi:hypothetical protein BH11PSE11_BH11PSE11_17560 [soil metagenome]
MNNMTTKSNQSLNDPMEARRQGNRIQMAAMAVVNILIEGVVLAMFARAGTIPDWIAGTFLFVAGGAALAIFFFIKQGINLRCEDRDLLVPQLVINGAIQLVFLYLAPQLAIIFLLVLSVIGSYGVIQFTPRQLVASWLIYGGATGLTLWLARDRFAYPGTGGAEIALVWVSFFLAARVHSAFGEKFSRMRKQLADKNHQIQVLLVQIEDQASHDPLTGVFNRRSLLEKLKAELQRVYRTGHPFCFVMLDLDHFKDINDKFGQPLGDLVLKKLSECADQSLRTLDSFGRLGGEEFGIVLPSTWLDQGLIAMERLRKKVTEYDWESIAPGLQVAFSAGITTNAPGDTLETMGKRSEVALRNAKHAGGNRIVAEDAPIPEMPAMVPD